jgi:hypothetical protein
LQAHHAYERQLFLLCLKMEGRYRATENLDRDPRAILCVALCVAKSTHLVLNCVVMVAGAGRAGRILPSSKRMVDVTGLVESA